MPRDGEAATGVDLSEIIGIAYERWRAANPAYDPWHVLRGSLGMLKAAQRALSLVTAAGGSDDFSYELGIAGHAVLPDGGAGSRTDVLSKLSDQRVITGQMQALLANASLADFWTVMPALQLTATSCAKLTVSEPMGAGTGFLIGRRFVLTAAHVVERLIGLDGRALPDSADKLRICFPRPPKAAPDWPAASFRPAADWLRFWSRYTGTPPHLGEGDLGLLDCAMIELETEVPACVPLVDILTPPEPDSDQVHVVGFFGGNGSLVYDGGLVCLKETAADGRVRHVAGTVPGMSGSPCLDWKGRPFAIHEGTYPTPQPHNRGVALRAIRRAMCEGQYDPLGPSQASRLHQLELFDVRQAWTKHGADPGELTGPHPVFGRPELQDWITGGLGPNRQPIAFISGSAGKSFSVDILRARCNDATDPIVHITPEVVQSDGPAAILRRILAAAGARPGLLDDGDPQRRPEEGLLRLDLLVPTFAELASRKETALWHRLWVTVDLGGPGAWALPDVSRFWEDFLKLAIPHAAWLRVVLIGLHKAIAATLAFNLDRDAISLLPIGDLDWSDVWATMRRSQSLPETEHDARLAEWIARVPDPSTAKAAIETVRFVLGRP